MLSTSPRIELNRLKKSAVQTWHGMVGHEENIIFPSTFYSPSADEESPNRIPFFVTKFHSAGLAKPACRSAGSKLSQRSSFFLNLSNVRAINKLTKFDDASNMRYEEKVWRPARIVVAACGLDIF
jgi:hypothetical protein